MAVLSGLFFVLLAIAAVVADDTDAIYEKNKHIVQKCLDESGTTPENFLAFANKEPYPQAVTCLMKCFLVTNKAMKEEDGSFDVETIVGYAGEARRESITKCAAQVTKPDLCDRAEQYELCFLDEQTDFFRTVVNRILGLQSR